MALGRWAGGRVSAVQLPPLKRAELGKGAELGKRLFKVYGERSGLFRVLLRSEPGKKRNSLLFPSPPPPPVLMSLKTAKRVFGEDGGFLGAGTSDGFICVFLGRKKRENLEKSVVFW